MFKRNFIYLNYFLQYVFVYFYLRLLFVQPASRAIRHPRGRRVSFKSERRKSLAVSHLCAMCSAAWFTGRPLKNTPSLLKILNSSDILLDSEAWRRVRPASSRFSRPNHSICLFEPGGGSDGWLWCRHSKALKEALSLIRGPNKHPHTCSEGLIRLATEAKTQETGNIDKSSRLIERQKLASTKLYIKHK